MGVVITNPTANIPVAPKSHTRGWSQMWADQLLARIDHKCSENITTAEIVCIDHGVNFGGTLNLFGGANEEVFNKFNNIMNSKLVISLDIQMPDYGAMLKQRIGATTTYSGITEEWCDKLSSMLNNCNYIDQYKMCHANKYGITIGDSHSTAFAAKNDRVFRTNGKTLFSVLKSGLESELHGVNVSNKTVLFQFGSIDIRHHILRNNTNISSMVEDYVKQGKVIADKHNCNVQFCAPVPVEYEGRKLPKTGYYKGTPFFGTRQERYDATMEFIGALDKFSNGNIVTVPYEWYTMDPEEYANTYMEMGGSVHIAPIFYRSQNWGVKNV